MSILTRASGAPVTRIVDGKTYTFPKLRRKEIGELMGRWSVQDRESIKRTLTDSKVLPIDFAKEMNDFNERARLISYGYRCLFEYERAAESILASLAIANPGTTPDDLDALPFAPDELTEIACESWGMKRNTTEGNPLDAIRKVAEWPEPREASAIVSFARKFLGLDQESAGPLDL